MTACVNSYVKSTEDRRKKGHSIRAESIIAKISRLLQMTNNKSFKNN